MFWKLPAAAFAKRQGEGNRRSFRKIVLAGGTPGILAYDGGKPVGWCAVEPREAYPRLARSADHAPARVAAALRAPDSPADPRAPR